MIFRKVTGGLRAEWGAKVYTAAATLIATGRLHGLTALEALRTALDGKPAMKAATNGPSGDEHYPTRIRCSARSPSH